MDWSSNFHISGLGTYVHDIVIHREENLSMEYIWEEKNLCFRYVEFR